MTWRRGLVEKKQMLRMCKTKYRVIKKINIMKMMVYQVPLPLAEFSIVAKADQIRTDRNNEQDTTGEMKLLIAGSETWIFVFYFICIFVLY